MESLTLFEIAERVIGGIVAVGETYHDDKCKRNIEQWDSLLYHIVKRFVESAKGDAGRYQYSVKEVSDKSREKLKEIYDYIGEYLDEWENEKE